MADCALIFNPAAKGGKARFLRRHLDAFGSHCRLMPTQAAGDASRLAAQALAEGCQTIIAAGGDGTINEVVNGIAETPGGLERALLGVLPMGTINVFARELGLPHRLRDAFDLICGGKETRIDLPVADLTLNGQTRRRCFIQLSGAGLDARAVELVSWDLKKKAGPLAYVVAGFKALMEKHPVITVEGGGQRVTGQLVFMGNGRFYGGSFRFFPKANLADGLIDACVFPQVQAGAILRVGMGMLCGRPLHFAQSAQLQARELVLTSSSRVPIELDGEAAGELPARISIIPKGLRVIVK